MKAATATLFDAAAQLPQVPVPRFQPYPQCRPSGVSWLGNIPQGWRVKRLRFTAQVNPTNGDMGGLTYDDEASFVSMEALHEYGGMTLEQTRSIGVVQQGYTHFRDGDIVVAKITPCFENGKGSIAAGLLNGIGFGTTELHVVRPSAEVDRRFLFYITISDAFRKLGAAEMYGAGGQKRVPDSFIKDFRLPLPPKPEQQAIAAFLDRETAKIDSLVAKKRRLIELLREKRTALISHAVTKGLNPAAPMKPSGIDWLGDVPDHWPLYRAKWTVTACQNGTWGADPDGQDDIACIRVADFDRIAFGVTLEKLTIRAVPPSERRGRSLKPGDLLLEKSGGGELQPVGAVVQYEQELEAVCSNFIARMPIAEGYWPRFLTYLHAHLYAGRVNTRSIKQNTGIQNLDSRQYLDEVIPHPPKAEQEAIGAFLDRETAKIDLLAEHIEQVVLQLHEYRSALISAAVTGKIDVRGEIPA